MKFRILLSHNIPAGKWYKLEQSYDQGYIRGTGREGGIAVKEKKRGIPPMELPRLLYGCPGLDHEYGRLPLSKGTS